MDRIGNARRRAAVAAEKQRWLGELELHEDEPSVALDAIDARVEKRMRDPFEKRARLLDEAGRRLRRRRAAAELGLHAEIAGSGLVLGYAALSPDAIRKGVRILAKAIRS